MDFLSTNNIFAVISLLLFLGYWVFNFIILYHLARFGVGTQPKKFAAMFLFGSVALFSICVVFFAGVDLNNLKTVFDGMAGSAFNITLPQ